MTSVLQVNHSDSVGGAARAAYRLHNALRVIGGDSTFLVARKRTDDPTVVGPSGTIASAQNELRRRADRLILRSALRASAGSGQSISLFPGPLLAQIERSPVDVVNLHWINQGAMSVGQIGKISKPTAWTMHDMWALTGASHYDGYGADAPWVTGYPGRSIRDADRVTARRKVRNWRRPRYLVAPSRWMADCLARSPITADWPRCVIPNPVPVSVFSPRDIVSARAAFGLPQGAPLILFGAHGGIANSAKGWDLLLEALRFAAQDLPGAEVAVFGQGPPTIPISSPVPIRWLGRIDNDDTLATLYSAATVMAVPSRDENLPQTAVEATSCGTPVVAFRTGGLPDIVEDGITGGLARPFETSDFATQLVRIINANRQQEMLRAVRERALRIWEPEVVARQYLELYAEIAAAGRQSSN